MMQITKKPGEKTSHPRLDRANATNGSRCSTCSQTTSRMKSPTLNTTTSYGNSSRPSREDAGWYLRADDLTWQRFSTEKVKLRLLAMGNVKPQVELILGSTIGKAWKLVNVHFKQSTQAIDNGTSTQPNTTIRLQTWAYDRTAAVIHTGIAF